MCANFKPMPKTQAAQLGLQQLGLFEPAFDYAEDLYPGHLAPLIFANPKTRQAEWREVTFGMVPKWSDDRKIVRSTYNARSETVDQKPSFKNAWQQSQFALIPVQMIFEPRYVNGIAERWGIYREDGQPFTVAAIYENALIDGQQVRSMSMLTINADQHPLMSQFHHPDDEKRSIVVIPEKQRWEWLTTKNNEAMQFLQGLSAEFVAAPMPRIASNTQTTNLSLFD